MSTLTLQATRTREMAEMDFHFSYYMNIGDIYRRHEEYFGLHDVAERKEPLTKVAALYFEWKAANNSATTVARETRIF
jgi:hypothetical protein